MPASNHPSRRTFLKTSLAAVAAPTIVPSTVFAKPGQPAPSDRVVIGLIGCGDLGRRHHLNNKLLTIPRFQVAAVCDVDRNRRDQAATDVLKKTKKQPTAYKDFRDLCDRKDIDAVLTALPDHWHALAAIYAMESGKDVYGEKPLALTIAEGRAMVNTARRYGRVFQTGSQQRSTGLFAQAVELVRNGKIGKLKRIDTFVGSTEAGTWQPTATPPVELDWNMWLGPAPWADYTPNRCFYEFRWYYDYSGGKLTDWGAHNNDIAQWGLDMDASGPVTIDGEAEFHEDGPYNVPKELHVKYTYAGGVELHCHSDATYKGLGEATGFSPPDGTPGVLFTGTDGWVFVNRATKDFQASNPELLKWKAGSGDVRLPRNEGHHENFLDCVASRELPIADVEVGHRSATVCHLGNISIRLGRKLEWDPAKEQFIDDEQANLMISKPMRAPWHL